MDAKIADLEKRLEAAEARAEDLARRLAEKEEQELLRMVTGSDAAEGIGSRSRSALGMRDSKSFADGSSPAKDATGIITASAQSFLRRRARGQSPGSSRPSPDSGRGGGSFLRRRRGPPRKQSFLQTRMQELEGELTEAKHAAEVAGRKQANAEADAQEWKRMFEDKERADSLMAGRLSGNGLPLWGGLGGHYHC